MRILIISHGHPTFHPGGGEIFAYGLYRSLRDNGEDVYFLACVYAELLSGCQRDGLSLVDDDTRVSIIKIPKFHLFLNSQTDENILTVYFAGYLKKLKPTVVHFHHTFLIGVEGLRIVRNILPHSKILLTLHDYMPICHRDGQMVRTNNMALCDTALPWRCNECFPELSPTEFRMREVFIKNHLGLVDLFLCPSQFLLNRYSEWGLPTKKLTYVANGHILTLSNNSSIHESDQSGESNLFSQETSKISYQFHKKSTIPHHSVQSNNYSEPLQSKSKSFFSGKQTRNRFAYFGQITPYKGVDVLLQAVDILRRQDKNDFQLEIHGTADLQEESFRTSLLTRIDNMGESIIYRGPYRPQDAVTLMSENDWIIIPSIWWENSPLTIEEAMIARRPVICSNIGGMKEKVQASRDGLHFHVGDANNLAMTMQTAMKSKNLWKKLHKKMRQAQSMAECLEKHLKLYIN